MLKAIVKDALLASGSALGNHIGSRVGAPIAGAAAGRYLAGRISRLVGSGDYTINTQGVATNSLIKGKVPVSISFDGRSVRLTHREFIGDVTTGPVAGNFNATNFVVNPSDSTTFPYLSNLASLFEKYKFHGLVFETISTCSPYLSTSSMGSIIASCQFNNQNPIFTSKTQMENTEHAISTRLDKSMIYGVECKDQVQNYYYTRHAGASPPSGAVSNMYDLADLVIATSGGAVAASTTVAELWVTYDVELLGPRMPDSRSLYYHSFGAGVTAAALLGTTRSNICAYGAAENITISSDRIINFNNFNVGDVLLIILSFNTLTAVNQGDFAVSGLTMLNLFAGRTNPVRDMDTFLTGTGSATCLYCCTITSANASFTFSTNWSVVGAGQCDLIITSLGYGLPATLL